VKRIAAIVLISSSLLFLTLISYSHSSRSSYAWVRAIDTGVKTWPRWVKPVVGNDLKLRMVANDRTFVSEDGINWSAEPNNAHSAVRPGVSQIFFNGKYWLMGGMNTWAEFTNEVWSSPDALNWTRVTEHAPWAPRRNALVVEFGGKLLLYGGSKSSGTTDVTPTEFYGEAWETSDGVSWARVSNSIPTRCEQILLFQNRIWMFGAGSVWSSSDSRNWELKSNDRPFSDRGGYGAAVYDGKLWVFGGVGKSKAVNEVWSSKDGTNWVQETASAPWFPRGGEYSVVYKNKLWIYGGKTGVGYDKADDVWFMSK
jgi:hypothetical protein